MTPMRVWGSAEALLLSCCVLHGALIWFLCPVGLDQSLWVWGVVSVWCFLLSLIGGSGLGFRNDVSSYCCLCRFGFALDFMGNRVGPLC